MTRAQTVRAIMLGASLADEAARDGVSVLGIGEMGIGNTTTSSAVLAALTTSVPEAAGTVRNWDYRFTWLRDAFFTVTALNPYIGYEAASRVGVLLEDIRFLRIGRQRQRFELDAVFLLRYDEL